MKIIIVIVSNILYFPPVISLVNILNKLKIQTILITTETEFDDSNLEFITLEKINLNYEKISNPIKKLFLIPFLKNKIWKIINKHYDDKTIIWSITDLSLKYLGNKIQKYRYILHFLELSEEIYYYKKLSFFKFDTHLLAEKAKAVVVPEYNRAHITQAWWNLSNIPLIFSNKPYLSQKVEVISNIYNYRIKNILKEIDNRKIILYQGIISTERPLDKIIKAVGSLGKEYAMVVMSGGKNIYENLGVENYYFIPFISPPYHLEITKRAYIGILSYFPTKNTGYSPLNSIYCAPNKIFEFGLFGIPMLGNNIPGLKYVFDIQKCGACLEKFEEEDICIAIKKIEANYENYSFGAKRLYSEVNSEEEVKHIINVVQNRWNIKSKI